MGLAGSWVLAAGQPVAVSEYNDAISLLFGAFPLGENYFPIIILIVGFIVTSLLLHRSKWGRYIYAIGDNEAAAKIAGVPVMGTKLLCYGVSGLLCAVGAIIYLYQNISATPGEGADYLRLSFAATIFGGVYMYGGNHSWSACRRDLPLEHHKRADDRWRSPVDLPGRPRRYRPCGGAPPGENTKIGSRQ